MSDCCYMWVTCRREDRKRFEALGFEVRDGTQTCLIEMHDDMAVSAHQGAMPEDIPYIGEHSAGSNYGAFKFACDGKTYAEANVDYYGDFSIGWSTSKNAPTAACLKAIRKYLRVLKRAQSVFEQHMRESRLVAHE